MSPRVRQKAPRHRKKPDPVARTVGARVRLLRLEKGFNFDAFVGETELGRGYVSELERGLVVPTVQVLARIAAVLEVTMADLVVGTSVREQLFEAARHLSPADVRALLDSATRRAEAIKRR